MFSYYYMAENPVASEVDWAWEFWNTNACYAS